MIHLHIGTEESDKNVSVHIVQHVFVFQIVIQRHGLFQIIGKVLLPSTMICHNSKLKSISILVKRLLYLLLHIALDFI